MKEFKYPFYAKLIYRWANIPLTFLLLIHWSSSVIGLLETWTAVLPLLLNTAVIYLLNRFYFRVYKTFPFKFEINNEKIICSDYMNKDRIVDLKLSEIDKLYGGIFTGQPMRPVYIESTKNNIKIGIFHHVKYMDKLLTIILSNIPTKLYRHILKDAEELRNEQVSHAKARRAKKKGK